MKTARSVLIPAAGYGRRMGSPAAKELLYSTDLQMTFIDHAIRLAHSWQATPIVVTRADKTELIEYLRANCADQIRLHLIEGSVEWADTCVQSISLLAEHSVLLLPDTQFSPADIGLSLFAALTDAEISAACFSPASLSTWGAIATSKDGLLICEKPKSPPVCTDHPGAPLVYDGYENAKAWGLLGFRKGRAHELFSKISRSHEEHSTWQKLECTYKELPLNHFVDLTRGNGAAGASPSLAL